MPFLSPNQQRQSLNSYYTVTTKRNQMFFKYNFKMLTNLHRNLACSTGDKCLTMRHKIIHFTSCMYAHYLVKLWRSKLWQKWCYWYYIMCYNQVTVNKNGGLRKHYLPALSTSFVRTVTMSVQNVTTRFKTRCRMVTPLLTCTCMMAWSGVAHALNIPVNILYIALAVRVSLAKWTECLSPPSYFR